MNPIFIIILTCIVGVVVFALYNTYKRATSVPISIGSDIQEKVASSTYREIVVAGGCFWCTESEYDHKKGVVGAYSGYIVTKSTSAIPDYSSISNGQVRGREAVKVVYDPTLISDEKIIEIYLRHIDPTDGGGQFADRGYQYTPAIYVTTDHQKEVINMFITKMNSYKKFASEIAVEVASIDDNIFYPAEEYHQDYKDKNPVRYNAYREASGRNTFIRKHWSDDSSFIKELFTTIITPSMQSWKTFTKRDKEERIKTLSPLSYRVTQEEGTEPPFKNEYHDNKEEGIYVDIVSGEPIFSSRDKYDSGTGWPSFVKPLSEDGVTLHIDNGIFSTRTEVRSKIADSHLGHVFDDGPSDRGGKRYCMNSAALRFIAKEKMKEEGYEEYYYLFQ